MILLTIKIKLCNIKEKCMPRSNEKLIKQNTISHLNYYNSKWNAMTKEPGNRL